MPFTVYIRRGYPSVLMHLLCAWLIFLSSVAYADDKPLEWEHGWKTADVIATRYQNPTMGYNIGFQFPRNQNKSDRAELSDFMAKHGGYAYQMGGYPGAEMFIIFKDVKDRETANKKLKAILPALSKLIRSL